MNGKIIEIHDPSKALELAHTAIDWAYSTEKEPQLNNQKIFWPRGKVLGGSNALNYMVYLRGHRIDFDHWQALGNKGWGYADILPYFKAGSPISHRATKSRFKQRERLAFIDWHMYFTHKMAPYFQQK